MAERSLRSAPAQKTRGAELRSTTARTLVSKRRRSSGLRNSSIMARPRAFLVAGRLSDSAAVPPSSPPSSSHCSSFPVIAAEKARAYIACVDRAHIAVVKGLRDLGVHSCGVCCRVLRSRFAAACSATKHHAARHCRHHAQHQAEPPRSHVEGSQTRRPRRWSPQLLGYLCKPSPKRGQRHALRPHRQQRCFHHHCVHLGGQPVRLARLVRRAERCPPCVLGRAVHIVIRRVTARAGPRAPATVCAATTIMHASPVGLEQAVRGCRRAPSQHVPLQLGECS
jgi:hypothetical protein